MRFHGYVAMLFAMIASTVPIADAATWQLPTGQGAPTTQVGRYTTTANTPTREQRNPLLMLVQVQFPSEVNTIGDAVNYLLRYSGYRLVDEHQRDASVNAMLAQPLPIVDRHLGSLSLQDALQVLANPDVFTLVVDPVNRLVGFRLRTKYKATWGKITSHNTTETHHNER